MAREYFKNLPDTSTPLKAERFNGFLNGEESIEKLVVGDIECKQLFDKNNANILNAYMSTGKKILSDSTAKVIYVSCDPNTTYTISKRQSSRFYFGYTSVLPANNVDVIDMVHNDSATKLTITTNSEAKYLCAYVYHPNYDTSFTLQELLDTLQIEEGEEVTTPTTYKKFGYNSVDSMGEIVVDDISCKNKFVGTGWRKVYTANGYPQANDTVHVDINSSGTNNINFKINQTYAGVESGFHSVKAGEQLTLSFNGSGFNRLFVTQYDSNKNRVSTLNATASLGETTVTATQDGYIAVGFGSTTAVSNAIDITEIQLELGDKATPYTSYKEFGYTLNNPDELSKVTPIEFTPTNGSSYNGYGNCYYYKIGSRVHVHLGLRDLTQGNASLTIYTLPVGYRPKTNITAVGYGDEIFKFIGTNVAPNGIISLSPTTNSYAQVDFEYDAFA